VRRSLTNGAALARLRQALIPILMKGQAVLGELFAS
jgi:hypothetical protein